MTARPSKSRFMGRTYKVAFSPEGTVGDGTLWGQTDHSAQTIQVEEGLSHDKERGIITHEMLHQLLSLSGLALSESTEEAVCTYLGEALVGHIRDNPTFWRYLLQRPPKT